MATAVLAVLVAPQVLSEAALRASGGDCELKVTAPEEGAWLAGAGLDVSVEARCVRSAAGAREAAAVCVSMDGARASCMEWGAGEVWEEGDMRVQRVRAAPDSPLQPGVHWVRFCLHLERRPALTAPDRCADAVLERNVSFVILPLIDSAWWTPQTASGAARTEPEQGAWRRVMEDLRQDARVRERLERPGVVRLGGQAGGSAPFVGPGLAAGAVAGSPRSVLVAMAVGELLGGVGERVRRNLAQLRASPQLSVDCALFVYSATEGVLDGWRAATDCTVVWAGPGMKWKFLRRFLSPTWVADGGYEWVFVLDEDAVLTDPQEDAAGAEEGGLERELRSFDAAGFVQLASVRNWTIVQPALWKKTSSTYSIVTLEWAQEDLDNRTNFDPAVNASADRVFPWAAETAFVECGPFAAFHASVWPCVHALLQPDLGTGYGYDLIWEGACAPGRAGIVYATPIWHADSRSASSRPNFLPSAVAEGVILFERLAHVGLPRAVTPPDARCLPPASDPRCRVMPQDPNIRIMFAG